MSRLRTISVILVLALAFIFQLALEDGGRRANLVIWSVPVFLAFLSGYIAARGKDASQGGESSRQV
jgi:hypothetical protein